MPWPEPQDAIPLDSIPPKDGLGPKDRTILDHFIRLGLIPGLRVWINQVVGNLPDWHVNITDPVRHEWVVRTYSKRPDLVIDSGQNLWIVEIKPYASYVALGQSLMYAELASLKPEPIHEPIPVILTDIADRDLVTAARAHPDLTIFELGFFSQDRPKFPT